MSVEKMIISGIAVVVAGLVVMAFVANYYDFAIKAEAMKQGYSQQTVQGERGVWWVKDGKPLRQ